MSNNPLLEPSTLPNAAPVFSKIKTEHFLPAIEEAIKEARENIDKIIQNDDAPSFDNTIVDLETASETLDDVLSIYYNQLSCIGGDELHALTEKIGPLSANFSSDIILNPELFARIQDVHERKDSFNLTTEQKTLLDNNYKSFVRGGAMLNDEQKDRLREINQSLSTLSPEFMNNATKSAEAFSLIIKDKQDLSGLPDTAIAAASHAATEKGHDGQWLISLDYPSYIPFMQFSENRDLREKVWRAFANRAWGDEYDNAENIKKITALKHERATLLGYDDHAHYVLERRMAKNKATVMEFLDTLKEAYKPAAEKELENLKNFAKDYDGSDDLQPWDISYYSEKLKQKLFDFSSEDLRPYFPLDHVLKGCFEHFGKLFGLSFEDASGTYDVWHEDVKTFNVIDKKTKKFIGTLYGDFFPRTGKNQGAWKTSYRSQGLYKGKIERPVIAIVCNFTKPTPDKPSLITHGEVTTLFHEMGHAVHALLSDVTYGSLAGTSVLWDFVELPSQLQENWAYEKETLDLFASHYETGETIPTDLIEKLRNAKNFMMAWGGLRQTSFGYLDMAWHTTDPKNIGDVAEFEDEAIKDCALFPRLAGPMSSSFSHIFAGGYSAGYYSYKWAEVLDADAFEAFLENGLYDSDTAEKYKSEILMKGGSDDPQILYQRFRGRDADPGALLRREGLLETDEKAA